MQRWQQWRHDLLQYNNGSVSDFADDTLSTTSDLASTDTDNHTINRIRRNSPLETVPAFLQGMIDPSIIQKIAQLQSDRGANVLLVV